MFLKDKRITFLITIVLSLVLLFVFFRSEKAKKQKQEIAVNAMIVSMSKVSTSLESIGTAISNEATNITSNISQIVDSVNFSDCEAVKKGQILVQLNIDKKKAAQKQAKINLSEQKREHDRLLSLKQKKVVPEKEFDIQLTKLHDAQAKLDEIDAEIKESSITAPFDGVLGIRNVSVGALVSPGTVITTIDDISKLKVDFPIPEKYMLLLKQNGKIIAESAAVPKKKFEGHISAISPRISPTSRSIYVRGIIDNTGYLLRPGMMLKISVRIEDRNAIQIPERCVSDIGERRFVFLIKEIQGKKFVVNKKYIKTGELKKGLVEVKKGLKSGDRIVADGIGKLSDGDEVNIIKDIR